MRFNEITYDQVIAGAKLALNLENTTDYDGFLLLKLDEAMRSLDDRGMRELRTEVLPLDEGTAPLPCGFLRAMAIWFQGSAGRCTLAPYVDRNIVNYCDCGTDGVNLSALGTSYQINGNHIVFHNPEAISAEEVSLAYLGMRLDENNQPIILESHERAGIAYLVWRFKNKMMSAERNLGMRNALRGEANDAKNEFRAQSRYIKGEANKLQWDEDKKSIGRTFNAWITRDNKRSIYSMP
jgi:hypothetical protein